MRAQTEIKYQYKGFDVVANLTICAAIAAGSEIQFMSVLEGDETWKDYRPGLISEVFGPWCYQEDYLWRVKPEQE